MTRLQPQKPASPRPQKGEAKRLAALARYEILDTPPEKEFDELVQLAARICDTPIALMTLLDETRQWFKSRVGLSIEETPREIAFCDHAIREDGLLEVADARSDPRFRNNPLVTGDPNIRFYAGVPLLTLDGQALGTLCVIDHDTRLLQAEQRGALAVLARHLVSQLELRYALRVARTEVRHRQAAEAELQALNRNLEDRVQSRTRALRALSAHLQSIRENERTRISREIHDDLGQRLTALKMDLKLLAEDWPTAGPNNDEAASIQLASIVELVDTSLHAVRRIAQELRPDVLDALGLLPGIEWLLQDMQSRAGLQGVVTATTALPELSDAQTTAIFRIVQEAVTNVVRHAQANQVKVDLSCRDPLLSVSIQDDGQGFQPTDNAELSLGLLGMRERAAEMGATLDIASQPGQGTRVTLTLPIRPETVC